MLPVIYIRFLSSSPDKIFEDVLTPKTMQDMSSGDE